MAKIPVSTIVKVAVSLAGIALTFVEKKLADQALDAKVAEKVAEAFAESMEES